MIVDIAPVVLLAASVCENAGLCIFFIHFYFHFRMLSSAQFVSLFEMNKRVEKINRKNRGFLNSLHIFKFMKFEKQTGFQNFNEKKL